MEVPDFKKIAEVLGEEIPSEQEEELRRFIEATTSIESSGHVTIPLDSPEFKTLPVEKDPFCTKIKAALIEMLSIGGKLPSEVVVLSEEETPSPNGFVRFRTDIFMDKVVPYICAWGVSNNYWITNGSTRTVTLPRGRSHIFWNQQAPVRSVPA